MPVKQKAIVFCRHCGREKIMHITSRLLQIAALVISQGVWGQKPVDRTHLLQRASDTMPKVQTVNTAILASQNVSTQTGTQTVKTIDRDILYRNFQQPDSTVKYKVVRNGTVIRNETAKLDEVQLKAGEKLVLQPRKEIERADVQTVRKLQAVSSLHFVQANLQVLPELIIESRDSGARQISYQLYFFPYEPLTYNDTTGKFQSRMGFFFLRPDSVQAANPIDPVNIIITSSGLKQVSPRSLSIDHLSFPVSDVEVAGDGISDSVEIRVITASRPEGYRSFLKIKPALDINTNRYSLQGYGIQKVPIEVRLIGSNSGDSLRVDLSASKGTVTPDAVTLRYNQPQTVYLTSEGTGDILISAKSSSLQSPPRQLHYSFPWYFLIASIIGGLLGGFAKYYSGRKKKFSMRPITGGILAALMGALAYYALGISLLNFKMNATFNEFAVLALSALFAYFGIPKGKEG